MRIIVFFDLPTESLENKKEYRKFRKYLIKKGFLMMQESVYCKLALNQTIADLVAKDVKRHRPTEGIVQMMTITEKQFSKIESIVGERQNTVVDSDDRVIVL